MSNSEKIQILKENIKNYIINSKILDENCIFNFAKQQAKEMRIEISKGEIKSIIYEIISSISSSLKDDFSEPSSDYSLNSIDKLIEKAERSTFSCHLDI